MLVDLYLGRASWRALFIAPTCLLAFLQQTHSLYVKMPYEMDQLTARGMHDASRNSTTFSVDEVKPESTNGWDVLHKAFSTVLTFNFCTSSSYTKYFNKLPPISLSNLRIPPNTKMLFYGTSMLHEVLNNIAVANQDILIKRGNPHAADGNVQDRYEADLVTGYITTYEFQGGRKITEVQNYQPLQIADNVHALQKFMDENYFDIAFFMNPLPRCVYIKSGGDLCKCLKRKDPFPDPFGCDKDYEGFLRGQREEVRPLWDVINKSMEGKVYEVEGWTDTPFTAFKADDEHTIRSYPILNGHACNTDGPEHGDCGHDAVVKGHQCQPGRVAFISELVMAKVN